MFKHAQGQAVTLRFMLTVLIMYLATICHPDTFAVGGHNKLIK